MNTTLAGLPLAGLPTEQQWIYHSSAANTSSLTTYNQLIGTVIEAGLLPQPYWEGLEGYKGKLPPPKHILLLTEEQE